MDLLNGKKLSQREKVLLILVGVAAIAAAFYFFIYQSQIDQMASIKSQLSENNKKLDELKGFDGQLKSLEKEVDKLDTDIYDATKKWFPSLRQDVIIKDLENKIKLTNLTDGSVTFKSSQEANIAEFDDEENPPSIAEALTLSFVTLMQEHPEIPESTATENVDDGKSLIEKTADALAAPTPTPGPDGNETTTAFAAQAGVSSNTQSKNGELTPDVQEKLNTLKQSLSGLTENELKQQINEILAKTEAKVDKMEVVVTFKNSSYRSIMDFIYKVENTSPNIYVSALNYSNTTSAYIAELQSEEDAKEKERVTQLNLFRKAEDKTQIQPNEIVVDYKGVDKYSGSITLVYFAVSKIHSPEQ